MIKQYSHQAEVRRGVFYSSLIVSVIYIVGCRSCSSYMSTCSCFSIERFLFAFLFGSGNTVSTSPCLILDWNMPSSFYSKFLTNNKATNTDLCCTLTSQQILLPFTWTLENQFYHSWRINISTWKYQSQYLLADNRGPFLQLQCSLPVLNWFWFPPSWSPVIWIILSRFLVVFLTSASRFWIQRYAVV